MALQRLVEREFLDELSPLDPRAIGSRRDLCRINAWMMQAKLMARLLASYGKGQPRTILDLGSGDGTFMLKVARRLSPIWRDVTVQLLDTRDLVTAETRKDFSELGWTAKPLCSDVFEALPRGDLGVVDAITANLFLHHFDHTQLHVLLAGMAQKTSFIAACEPRRSAFALTGSRMLFAIGCNDVSRHDAVVSVKAGFRGKELSETWCAADLSEKAWRLEERPAGLFTHTFVARRIGTGVCE